MKVNRKKYFLFLFLGLKELGSLHSEQWKKGLDLESDMSYNTRFPEAIGMLHNFSEWYDEGY